MSKPLGGSAPSTLPLLALGLGAFGIGTTEFAPMGLLPAIAGDLGISIPAAGQIVTAYAVGVMAGAPLMTLLLSRFGHRAALMLLMALFVAGNLASALAPGYWALVAARVATSFSQGAFFGFGAVVATSLVVPERRASAVATMFMGLSIANILGVPAATWAGGAVGWRAAFAGTAVLGLIALGGIAATLPAAADGSRPKARELAALFRPQMLRTIAATILFAGSFFAIYTYVAPILQDIGGAGPGTVTLMLVLIGIGLTAGNWLGGKLADRSLWGGAAIGMGALALTSLAVPFAVATPAGAAIGLVAWSAAAFACVPALQMRAMQAAENAPSMAAAINISAFNLGNAVGASAGGAALGAGFGYSAVPVVASLIALAGLAVLWADRRSGEAPLAAE